MVFRISDKLKLNSFKKLQVLKPLALRLKSKEQARLKVSFGK